VFDPQQNRPTAVNMPVREADMETSKNDHGAVALLGR
jgi:hypothetical protein